MTLRVKGLGVALRGRQIIANLSFDAPRGEFIIVVGPNGAGKTTLLKSIAGLLKATGCIHWDGQSIAGALPLELSRLLAYLPQGHVAHWPMIARDIVAIGRQPFASSLNRLSHRDLEAIEHALNAVDAVSFADRPITELSGGERARIMLARTLAADRPLLLADEPVASLDPAHQLAVMRILAQQARSNKLVVAVSHDLLLAARFADRVMVMSDGRIAAFGPVEQALTSDLLRGVFRVEPLRFTAEAHAVEIPWYTVDR